MNLSEIETKLYKATVSCISVLDAFGEHIGKDTPKRSIDTSIRTINTLYVAGKNIQEAAGYLHDAGIYTIRIEEISRLLNVPDTKAN